MKMGLETSLNHLMFHQGFLEDHYFAFMLNCIFAFYHNHVTSSYFLMFVRGLKVFSILFSDDVFDPSLVSLINCSF